MINPVLMAILLAVLAFMALALAGVSVWLHRRYRKLKADFDDLSEILHGLNNDFRDYYSATLMVDERLTGVEQQAAGLSEKIANFQQQDASNHPYGMAIQKVRSGASVSELMQTAGLSQDEAALLIRLHGAKAKL